MLLSGAIALHSGFPKMNKLLRIVLVALVTTCVATGAYWYYSPYLAMKGIAAAAKDKDADKFNESVDYPRLRESLKGQFSAHVAKIVGDQSANAFSSLGAMLGIAMVNQMVDSFVRPEMVMQMMKDGEVKADKNASDASDSTNQRELKWITERKGPDRVIATPQKGTGPENAEALAFVFDRSGFANWKLTELRVSFPEK